MSMFARPAAPATATSDVTDPESLYALALRTEGPLPLFLDAVVEELFAMASGDDAAAFLRLVGGHMARGMSLEAVETLEALEGLMNAALTARRWGWVRLSEVEAGIRIRHGGLPVRPSSTTGQAMAALLEGLYGHWLEHAGGSADLKARHTGTLGGETVELVYGR
ncbi:hypothetical protein L2U69_10840 [Zavarzinia compransoris]|uniref:cellulose biosynthesis protein BcsD n=1 Tax=Zavarzinia marina TaxID=2911065 RepID=UPI001F17406F|nr:cellulose biosynthesis protein BcsD [Zavarzinia marina]MCF4166140.1 hypothetical protein [Zavarzinia marina]